MIANAPQIIHVQQVMANQNVSILNNLGNDLPCSEKLAIKCE
jgi:hypothetical protein